MAMDRMALLEALNNTLKLPVVEVDVPELGDKMFVRGLTVGEQDSLAQYSRLQADGKAPAYGWRALTLAKGICDESGKRLFTDADANALSRFPIAVAERLVNAIDKASGTAPAEAETIAKN